MNDSAVSYLSYPREPALRGQAGVDRAREFATQALADAAARMGAPLPQLNHTALGAPRAFEGWHVSKTHAEGLVAAAISKTPIGIDAEWIHRPRLRAARESARAAELELLGVCGEPASSELVLLWTGKEAVLKQVGLGLTGISRCRLIERVSLEQLRFELDDQTFLVSATRIDDYWLSVSGEALVLPSHWNRIDPTPEGVLA